MNEHRSPDPPARRQVVKFSFYRVDPAWRVLPAEERKRGKREVSAAVEAFSDRLQIRSYSVVGMRGDADILLWQIGDSLDDVQQLASVLLSTSLGPYLTMPHSYLAMTRRSVYVSGDEARQRQELRPADSKYFFVYPFIKTREWYQLPLEERQTMMDEHIAIGRKYPSVKLNTTYSFGLDDQEFVVSFETDEPADFLDLVMELREAKTSLYTLRDTPIFTCIAMPLRDALDTLDGTDTTANAAAQNVVAGAVVRGVGRLVSHDAPTSHWTPVANIADAPEGAGKLVHYHGEQVALNNSGGTLYAIANCCSHANGPLVDGVFDGATVTCPYHDSCFDLTTGEPIRGPANRRLPVYEVKVVDGAILLAVAEAAQTQL